MPDRTSSARSSSPSAPGTYRGRRIRLAGFLKTRGANDGAGLWMRVDGTDSILAFDNMNARRIRWTRDWQEVEVVLDVAQKAQTITFGLILVGNGKAWIDDVRIEIVRKDVPSTNMFDQEKPGELRLAIGGTHPANLDFEEGLGRAVSPGRAVNAAPLTQEQARWLRASIIPFETAEAGRGFADLQPLKPLIGAARVVALGEGTHGTREFFQMKHRLTEFLAAEMGFTLFVIEANMPEAYRINEYVLTGKGQPERTAPRPVLLDVGYPGSARPDPLDASVQRVGPGTHPVPRLRHAVRRAGDEQHTGLRRRFRSGLHEGPGGRLSETRQLLGLRRPHAGGPRRYRTRRSRRRRGGRGRSSRTSRRRARPTRSGSTPTGSTMRSRTRGSQRRRRS